MGELRAATGLTDAAARRSESVISSLTLPSDYSAASFPHRDRGEPGAPATEAEGRQIELGGRKAQQIIEPQLDAFRSADALAPRGGGPGGCQPADPIPFDTQQNGLNTHSMPPARAELGNLRAITRSFQPNSHQYGIDISSAGIRMPSSW
jgi:hypothetical protein